MSTRKYRPGTAAVWAGEEDLNGGDGITTPIINSVAFNYRDLDEWYNVATGKSEGHIYSRNTNPTVAALEEKIRVLENAEAATAFSTGMAAISNCLFAFLTSGKRVVSIKESVKRYLKDVRICRKLTPTSAQTKTTPSYSPRQYPSSHPHSYP
jgi:cystathionine gamma-synthase